MSAKQRYVRNTKTGVIFPFSPELGRHRNCVVLSLELGDEYERRAAESPAAVSDMERRLMNAEAAGEALSSDDLARSLEDASIKGITSHAVVTGTPFVPDDFDVDIDLGTLGKPDLTAIATKLNLPLPTGMKVAQMREAISQFLDDTKAIKAQEVELAQTNNAVAD